MQTDDFFAALWQQYTLKTPQAKAICQLFSGRGEQVVNDHVAFRTFDCPQIGIDALEPHLLKMGYRKLDDYTFPAKKLDASAYLHPDSTVPKVFLSALRRGVFSPEVETVLDGLIAQIPDNLADQANVFWSGLAWARLSLAEFEVLATESEYASWLSVHGLCANHFTVSVNHLQRFSGLADVLEAVKQAGYALNTAGGEIKGEPKDLLIQGSTLADRQTMIFSDAQSAEMPTCYYEFAERFPDASGNLYQGFLAANADKIFESTHR